MIPYTDAVVLRDRDANTAWAAEADGTLEERVYYCQNWRADVSAILTATGKMVEWVKYSAYGVPFALPAGDTDSDGDWDATDAAAILNSSSYDVRQDAELDGDVDSSDAVHAHSITGAYQTLGRGVLSSAAVNNRRGYAGYEFDPTFEGAERWLYHVRHRVYDAEVGRWTRRDPLGYVDGMSLYEYVGSRPLISLDPRGLACSPIGCSIQQTTDVQADNEGVPPECPIGNYQGPPQKRKPRTPPPPLPWIPVPTTPPWGPPAPPRKDPNWIDCQSACIYTAQVWRSACLTCTARRGASALACQESADVALKLCLAACVGNDTSYTAPTAMYNTMCRTLARCKATLQCGTPWLPLAPLPPGMPNPPPGGPPPRTTPPKPS